MTVSSSIYPQSQIKLHCQCRVLGSHSHLTTNRASVRRHIAGRLPASRQVIAIVRASGDVHAAPLGGVSVSGATDDSNQAPRVAVLSYTGSPTMASAAVESTAEAFEKDPSTMYFCRPDRGLKFYRSILSCMLDWYPGERQIVSTVPPDAAAVVYVWPRLRPISSLVKILRGGLAPLLHIQPRRIIPGLDASDFFEGVREDFFKVHGPFLYLSVVGVRPERQGRGLGSALLAFICDRADAAGLHCYVEATSPRNQALYERYGFQLLKAWRANEEMPSTYILSRAPKPVLPEERTAAPDADGEMGAAMPALTDLHRAPAAPAAAAEAAVAAAEASGPSLADPLLASAATATALDDRLDLGSQSSGRHEEVQQQQQQQAALFQAHAVEERRRQFAARRRAQLQQRRQQAYEAMPYDEVDPYDMWPLWTSSSPPPPEWVAAARDDLQT